MSESDFRVVRLTAPIFQPDEYELRRLAENGFAIVQCDAEDPAAIARAVTDADIVATIGTLMPRMVIDAIGRGRARAIARFGVGTDKIDVARATELGIVV